VIDSCINSEVICPKNINVNRVRNVVGQKKIYIISKPSPTLGRYPFHAGGAGLFGHKNHNNYISEVQKEIDALGYEWVVMADDTEGDIEEIVKKGVMLVVCAPGLRFQFYCGKFNKKRVIYLNTMDYASGNAHPVIKKLIEIERGN